MKISKKQSIYFVKKMAEKLANLGAVPFISDNLQFDLNTKYGILWIRIDEDNNSCFTVYSRFTDTDKAPKIEGVNSYSGKFNHHLSGEVNNVVSTIIKSIKSVL